MHSYLLKANTLIGNSREALICDFGLARLASNVNTGLTTSAFNRTLRYTSIEAEEKGCATTASDVWSWGGLLLHVGILLILHSIPPPV